MVAGPRATPHGYLSGKCPSGVSALGVSGRPMPVIKVCGRFVSYGDGKWPQDLIMVVGSSARRLVGSSALHARMCRVCRGYRVCRGVLDVLGGGSEPNGW